MPEINGGYGHATHVSTPQWIELLTLDQMRRAVELMGERITAELYDLTTWDVDAFPERTRRNCRGGIHKRLEQLEESAVIHAIHVCDAEQIFNDAA